MNWLKNNLPMINIILIIGAAVFVFFNCALSRSPLIDDPTYPRACKTILEDDYFKQKNKGAQGGSLAMIGETCKGQLSTDLDFLVIFLLMIDRLLSKLV